MKAFRRNSHQSLVISIFAARIYASILLNKDLRSAIGAWIEENQDSLQSYTRQYSIKGGQRGIYASALGKIYQLLFGMQKKSINEALDVKYYETPKNNVHVTQLQRIAQIEDLSAKYIRRKGMNPLDAINAAAEALMIDVEEPRLRSQYSVHIVPSIGSEARTGSREARQEIMC